MGVGAFYNGYDVIAFVVIWSYVMIINIDFVTGLC